MTAATFMALLMGTSAIVSNFQITRSVRFRSAASAQLTYTPAAGNRQIWTWAGWVKRSKITASGGLFTANGTSDDTNFLDISFNASDQFVIQGGVTNFRISNALFRDTGAWFHAVVAVDTTQATAANRIRAYINGIELTWTNTTAPAQNATMGIGAAVSHQLGAAATLFLDGYMAQVYYINGQQLTPSSFGMIDPTTGVWAPTVFDGSYGTGGFLLDFSDNSSLANLGLDRSGNGNNLTPANVSITAGVNNDALTDSPMNYGTDDGLGGDVRGNYCTWNPLWQGRTGNPTNGNLDVPASSVQIGTFGMASQKWYWEITSTGGITTAGMINGSGALTTTTTVAAGVTTGFRADIGVGTIDYTTNGTTWTSLQTGLANPTYQPYVSTAAATVASLNAGQRPFAFTAPVGYQTLCTQNLTAPAVVKSASAFDAVLRTGTGANAVVSGKLFAPDLLWIRNRGGASSHWMDSARGVANVIFSDATSGDSSRPLSLTSFNVDGYSLGTGSDGNVNTAAASYIDWFWKKGAVPGFDIVLFTGTGAVNNVAHSLGVPPTFINVKRRDTTGNWFTYHVSLGNTKAVDLNLNAIPDTNIAYWNNTTPTGSVFTINGSGNIVGGTYVAYLFADVPGFSKFNVYTGNNLADGPFAYCGFRPRWILVKRIDATVGDWVVWDTLRDTINVAGGELNPDLSTAESVANADIDILSNGFKIRRAAANFNAAGTQMIFAAFAEAPFNYALAR